MLNKFLSVFYELLAEIFKIWKFENRPCGGYLLNFQKFSIYFLKLQKSRFYTFLHNFNFQKFLPPGTPIGALYPLIPPKTQNFENFDFAQIMSETDSQRFSAISENFLQNFALSPKALFRDFSRFSSIFAKKGKNRKILNLGPLHRLLSP